MDFARRWMLGAIIPTWPFRSGSVVDDGTYGRITIRMKISRFIVASVLRMAIAVCIDATNALG